MVYIGYSKSDPEPLSTGINIENIFGGTMKELSTTVEAQNFVKPHFIPELGKEGLSVDDIAKSLGVPAKHIRQKLGPRGGLRKISKLLGEDVSQFRVTSVTLHNVNELPFNEVFLSTTAAKLFVATYHNEIGEAYLAYLIRQDIAVEKFLEVDKERKLAQKQVLHLQECIEELRASQKELKDRLDALMNEPASDYEYEMIRKAMLKNLKRHHCNKDKYRQRLIADFESRYFKDDKGKKLQYLPRSRWRAALTYIENLDWNYFGPLVIPGQKGNFYKS